MRKIAGYILFAVLILPIYSLAEPVPPDSCPCSSQVINDTTGAEVLAEICPDGELAPNASLIFNENEISVFITEPSRDFAAGFFGPEGSPACEIGIDLAGVIEGISEEELDVCRLTIIEACGLDPSNTRAIPTLSEWGIIAMAGVLGLVALTVFKRKKQII